jgi:tRNA A37 threonylcarbamoyladenosine biosynthesis protein TsaE
VHVDLYRIESPVELDALGLPEYLATAIVFVEWGARFADFIAPDGLVLTLRPREVERGRVVELVARGSRGADIVAALASA